MKSLFSVLFFLLTGLGAGAQQYVSLFEDCQYGGRRFYLAPGSYRLFQIQIGNDRLSSLQVPSGLRVTIYKDDNFQGGSRTISSDMPCLEAEWNNQASSLVVEATGPVYNANEYVVFYNDCGQRGFSRTLRPGTYSGVDLGELKYNISSFAIFGNLQVKVYVNREDAAGFNTIFARSETCLSSNFNDRIGSLVIEPREAGRPVGSQNDGATFYTECNYEGNSMRLLPGFYSGEQLGLFRQDISSMEIPFGLQVKVYMGSDLNGSSLTLRENQACLSSSLNNRIGSLVVESSTGSGTGQPGGIPNPGGPGGDAVILYADASYRGQSATVLPGSYASMAQLGFPDKALSSLQVPPGFRVILYERENFGGKSYTITSSRSGFSFSGWNDRASSIRVYRDQ